MSKKSKSVLTVLFTAVFCLLIYCVVQINQTQQGIMFLTEKLAMEVAGSNSTVVAEPDIMPNETSTATPSIAPTAMPSTAPVSTPTPAPVVAVTENEPQTETVYWVPNGKVWHTTANCSTLSRSSNILSGTIEDSGKPRTCKKCG